MAGHEHEAPALLAARVAVRQSDDAACERGYGELLDRFGYEATARAWEQACREYEAGQ